MQLTPHFHTLLPDGVFVHDPDHPDASPRFRPLDPPSDDEVADLLMQVQARVLALLRRTGHLPETDADPAAEAPTDPLAAFSAEAVSPPPRPGPLHPAPIDLPSRPRTARQAGFSLHADLLIHANDRQGLERVCRYGLRPALAVERLSFTDDGRVRYRMKRTFADGTRDIVLTHARRARRVPRTKSCVGRTVGGTWGALARSPHLRTAALWRSGTHSAVASSAPVRVWLRLRRAVTNDQSGEATAWEPGAQRGSA